MNWEWNFEQEQLEAAENGRLYAIAQNGDKWCFAWWVFADGEWAQVGWMNGGSLGEAIYLAEEQRSNDLWEMVFQMAGGEEAA